jgi:hypothetical protein
MTDELFRIADAAIACALQDDPEGLSTLVLPLDDTQLRRLAVRLAVRACEAMVGWAAEAGVTPDQVVQMWQTAILMAEQHNSE